MQVFSKILTKNNKLKDRIVNVSNSPNSIIETVASYYENIIRLMPGNVYWLDRN
jgi:hypothetical protein